MLYTVRIGAWGWPMLPRDISGGACFPVLDAIHREDWRSRSGDVALGIPPGAGFPVREAGFGAPLGSEA
jgi:hypothetical protein